MKATSMLNVSKTIGWFLSKTWTWQLARWNTLSKTEIQCIDNHSQLFNKADYCDITIGY